MVDETQNPAVTLERGRPVTDTELLRRADWIRLQTVELIAQAGLGHYASTFSCAEIVATLYYHTLRLRPGEPRWPDRDRCSRTWATTRRTCSRSSARSAPR